MMGKKKNAAARTHNVYVIALDPGIAIYGRAAERFAKQNPDFKPGGSCFYVGKTARSPEERCNQHKAGIKASS